MKLAILLYGEYREFETAIESFSIFDEYTPDYYVSTWSTSDDGFVKQDVSEGRIKEFLPNAKVFISEDDDKIKDNEKKMRYHWRLLIKELEKFDNYDGVILSRIDLFIQEFNKSNFLDSFKPNTIYVPVGLKYNEEMKVQMIDDNFFFGDMMSICKFVNELSDTEMTSHVGIATSMINSKIEIKNSLKFCDVKIIRSNMKYNIKNPKFFENEYWSLYHEFVNQRNALSGKT